jgi:hypothetical protein
MLSPPLKRRNLTTLGHLLLLIQLGCTSYTLEAWQVLFWEKVVDHLGNLHEWRGADIFVAEDKAFEWGSLPVVEESIPVVNIREGGLKSHPSEDSER